MSSKFYFHIAPSALLLVLIPLVTFVQCSAPEAPYIQTVNGQIAAEDHQIWLSHEHILVDFIGADKIDPNSWNHNDIMNEITPYFQKIKSYEVGFFVDATPIYLGRDPILLQNISKETGINILTTTGWYGARRNKFIPNAFKDITAEQMAEKWVAEFQNGIEGTDIKPGLIKIGIDADDPLIDLHQKLVHAAALTHRKTGLTIASHTGEAIGLWPQLEILKVNGVSPNAFIWVHAQSEDEFTNYLKAAQYGCWISWDGIGWSDSMEPYVSRLQYAKENGFLDRILLSHDAGWFDPQKTHQQIKSYDRMFTHLYPALMDAGFSEQDWLQLVAINPANAYQIKQRLSP